MAGLLAFALVITTIAAVVLSRRDDGITDTPTQAIAVLPFADLSAGGEYAYFADGMTEELIARLAHVDGIHVVGRMSVFAFKDQAIDVRDIGARLNATAVLQSSVRHSGDRLRIVAQLVDATNGYQLWTETYEREVKDVFAIQDDIAQQIVSQLRGQVAGTEAPVPATAGTTDDPDAFNLYLKGRYE
ncbi:MAG: hypothetical protein KFH98_00240 [Gemmatimonadetes bacterium]|nr:hypothetical protein [Gemmatimonadota bacterium]